MDQNVLKIQVDEHPLLDLRAFVTEFASGLQSNENVFALLKESNGNIPLSSNDDVRKKVRDLLRHGGFKPTGRNKPACEYLLRAVAEEKLSPINAAVDACNVASYHSGLPISVVDLDLAALPLGVGIAPTDSEYVFNVSGQILKLDGLLCLFDANGPCANAVKDAQRTKTHAETKRTLSLIWGTTALPGRAEQTEQWYRSLLGEPTFDVELFQ